jgi:glutamine phosphoribosylpyrophosphate amidotransferase
MCGICGFIGHREDAAVVLRRMTETLAHRGPDDAGEWLGRGVAIGTRRYWDEHQERKSNHGLKLWTLLCWKLWCHTYSPHG